MNEPVNERAVDSQKKGRISVGRGGSWKDRCVERPVDEQGDRLTDRISR